jgi:hypothetical protein
MPALERSIIPCELPTTAFLRRYVHKGAYTDCYTTQIAARVTLSVYVEAFYTTAVFKVERFILRWLVSKPSSDADVACLAHGQAESFAAWSVEARAPDQLLLCDFQHRTRSWLMVAPLGSNAAVTRLYFGSAVIPIRTRSGQARLGSSYTALLGFHKLYSRILLSAARSRLTKAAGGR